MLRIENLHVSIQTVQILRGVNLELPEGRMAGIIGRNGAGKTTLMRSIMGLLPARSGSIYFNGEALHTHPAHRRAALGIGYMPEDRRLVPRLTAEENILSPAWALGGKDARERLRKIYGMIPETEAFAARKALQLSGGQQKLVAIARALMAGSRLILLDEPFEGVAPALSRRIAEVIAGLRAEGFSILLSGSDLQHSAGLLEQVFHIERGEVSPMPVKEKST
jgi:branched-chain amino acid transport system ATP-binding protein